MLNFEFSLPTKVLFGRDAENQIPDIIRKNGFQKVLLHTYDEEFIKRVPVYKKIKEMLKNAGPYCFHLPQIHRSGSPGSSRPYNR